MNIGIMNSGGEWRCYDGSGAGCDGSCDDSLFFIRTGTGCDSGCDECEPSTTASLCIRSNPTCVLFHGDQCRSPISLLHFMNSNEYLFGKNRQQLIFVCVIAARGACGPVLQPHVGCDSSCDTSCNSGCNSGCDTPTSCDANCDQTCSCSTGYRLVV